MGIRSRIFAACYDRMSAGAEQAGLGAHREALLADARGRVLEIGAGTGTNLEYYGGAVESLTLVEPEAPMAKKLEQRLDHEGRPVEVVPAPAEKLPFEDDQFDVAVATLVLCTVDDQTKALAEVRRVLKPGGKLLFIEHIRSDDPKVARLQDRMNGLNRIVAYHCNCNRSTLDAIREAGFSITELERDELKKVPKFVRPLAVGTARAEASANGARAAS